MRIPWKDTAIAALAVAAATIARWLLDPYLGFHLPYVTYFVAIVFIAWRTSTPVALAGSVAAWLIACFLFIEPRFSILIPPAAIPDVVGTFAFFTVALAIVFIADRMRLAQVQSESSGQQLDLISNRLPALISYIDSERRYVWCNEGYTRWFGLSREEIVGRRMEEVLGAEAGAASARASKLRSPAASSNTRRKRDTFTVARAGSTSPIHHITTVTAPYSASLPWSRTLADASAPNGTLRCSPSSARRSHSMHPPEMPREN